MNVRRIAGIAFAAIAALVLGLLFLGALPSQALSQRISFQILTGSTDGTYFPVGQLIAGLISHPPGVDRCENSTVCGPAGLIMSARTSDGAVANVLAVNSGLAESGMAQADVVAEAVSGKDAFRKAGKQSAVRVIAGLFPEDVHLLVGAKTKIATVADLRGKRVSIGVASSGSNVTARAVLAAYSLPSWRMHLSNDSVDVAAQLLQKGQIDAFFIVGGRPITVVDDLVAHGAARLVPIDGKGRDKLLKSNPLIKSDVIPAGTYRGMPAVQTVSVRALWVVNAQVPDALVYGIAKALFDRGNRAALNQGHDSAGQIRLSTAILELPAPLHPGAARFYRQAGLHGDGI